MRKLLCSGLLAMACLIQAMAQGQPEGTKADSIGQPSAVAPEKAPEDMTTVERVLSFVENTPKLKPTLFIVKPVLMNWFETPWKGGVKNHSKIEIGPVLNMVSINCVDGWKLLMGARTTAALNPHFFGRASVSYGFKSHAVYYATEFTYSFNKKDYVPTDFPQRYISFESTYDIMNPSDKFITRPKDNIVVGIHAKKVKEMYQYNRQKLSLIYETENGFSFQSWLKCEEHTAKEELHYYRMSDSLDLGRMRTTELSIGLHWLPGLENAKKKQYNMDIPDLYVRHTVGLNGFLGGQYTSNLTEIGFTKRQWTENWGNIDFKFDAAAQWNKVPYTSLFIPPMNLGVIDIGGTFEMLNNMEFMMDRALVGQINWSLNGKLCNHVPFLKKLQCHEHIELTGVWGKLTDKNNPRLDANQGDPDLLYLPDCTYIIEPKKPYLEAAIGLHHILGFISCEYVRRLNYNDHANIQKNGVRLGIFLAL